MLQPTHGSLVPRVNNWMRRLGTGYRVELRRLLDVDAVAAAAMKAALDKIVGVTDYNYPVAPERAKAWEERETEEGAEDPGDDDVLITFARRETEPLRSGLAALLAARERVDVVLVDERSSVAVRPSDVGVGISQVIPVIVAALYRGGRGAGAFVLIEQPELHIHPKLQVALADLFVEQSLSGTMSDHQFLLETHSEHILLRFLRRIREARAALDKKEAETASGRGVRASRGGVGVRGPRGRGTRMRQAEENQDGTVPSSPPALTPDKLSVIYVERATDGSPKFHPLRIDERGEFLDVWPEGFFEERDPELFG